MLNIIFKPHRASLKAGSSEPQKLFALLKIIPSSEAARTRPPLALALLLDTSNSMRLASVGSRALALPDGAMPDRTLADDAPPRAGVGTAGSSTSKLEQALQAAHALVADPRLQPQDRLAVICFDDDAFTALPLSALGSRAAAHDALDRLGRRGGSTYLAKGLAAACRELAAAPADAARRVLLLTDGRTYDEPGCGAEAAALAAGNNTIVAVGIGDDYNEHLLRDLAQATQGRPYHLQSVAEFQDVLEAEISVSVREVVTGLRAAVPTARGVQLESITRVYPSLAEVDLKAQPWSLGNVVADDYTVFTLEFTLAGVERPASRVRIAQVRLSGQVPGLGHDGEFPHHDLFVEFTHDEAAVAAVDRQVLGYVQQKNVDRMVQEAVRYAPRDSGRARHTLETALAMTQRVGNSEVTQMLRRAVRELERTGSLSAGTGKTMSLGNRTHTVRVDEAADDELPSEEEIRRVTGL